ncbi:hypothetical protein [Cryptosporangium phraense]|uniref:hypothetical protein n=1 Tax=Cryptosporangium phraense TaxID=2593070 RepID=UPI001478797E
MLSASRSGLSERQFRRPVTTVARRGGDVVVDGRPGRPWCLPLADRALPVAV